MSAFKIYQSLDIVDRLYHADKLRFDGASFSELPPITEMVGTKRYTIPIFVECSRLIAPDGSEIAERHVLNPLIFPALGAAREIERLAARVAELEARNG